MTQLCKTEPELQQIPDDEMRVLGVLLVFARHIRIIAIITIFAAVSSAAVVMRKPVIYTSSTRLLVLEFVDQAVISHVRDTGKVVYGKKGGSWKPADASLVKTMLESPQLNQAVAKSLLHNNSGAPEPAHNKIQIKQEKSIGVITVKVDGKDRNTTAQLATATVEEFARMAFRMGLLASPSLVLDEKLENSNGSSLLVRLLLPATTGVKVNSNPALMILVTTSAAFCMSVFLAFVIEYFRNMSEEGRNRLAGIRAVLKGKHQPNGRSK